ncbi:S8 family serine peptidase [Streptomyces cacaoi]|uniref:S8 family serine peptidase n=1 Tax=Streptomyces cacaoi TaxID=1898 RepID=UPI00263596BF|nr:S8 family serine peptidase [Streptomyces cacaoi]
MTMNAGRPVLSSRWLGAAAAGALACGTLLTGGVSAAHADGVADKQWYLDSMQAEEMWKVSTGKGVKVAVVDSGVDKSSPGLKGKLLPGHDASSASGDETSDLSGHGTTMAELIAGSGAEGTLKGLAPGAKIIPFRFATGKANRPGETAEAIRAAADSDAQIISMSFGAPASNSLVDALKYAKRKGKLLLASTGNDAKEGNRSNWPATDLEVAGIAAVDKSGEVTDFSSHGKNVDLAAPGSQDIPGRCKGHMESYCPGGGTSSATAITSASAALIWSKHPTWTANQVLKVLLDTAGRTWKDKDSSSTYVGRGAVRPRVNLLEGKGDPGPPDVSPLTGVKTRTPGDGVGKSTGDGKGESGSEPSRSAEAGAPDKVKVADSASGGNDGGGDGNSTVWIAAGAVGAVVVLGGGAFLALRSRRG